MSEYIDNGSIAVKSGDVLPLEVTNKCYNLFSVGTGLIFNADGLYLVTVYGRKIIVEKAVKAKHVNIKSEEVYPIVHARWIDLDDDCLCSACGAPWWYKENCTNKFRFCPNCGAKMDLE